MSVRLVIQRCCRHVHAMHAFSKRPDLFMRRLQITQNGPGFAHLSTSASLCKKGHDKGSAKDKKKKKHVASGSVDESIIIMDRVTQEMDADLGEFEQLLQRQLTIRADLRPYEDLLVDTPDGRTPLGHMARINQKSPTLLLINFGAYEAGIKPAKTALMEKLKVNPQHQANSLIVQLPRSTRQGRENMVKDAKKFFNDYKSMLSKTFSRHSKTITDAKDTHIGSLDECLNAEIVLKDTLHLYQRKGEEVMKRKQSELLEEQI